jgi:NifB/MoaA-like Fe-S oxidoreductase
MNDGAALDDSVRRLLGLYPSCRSLAIVPVGLTRHRRGLPSVRRVRVSEARALIAWAESMNLRFSGITGGAPFIQLADEFYLATRRALPPGEAYGDYPQLANGVGLCRSFISRFEHDIARLRRRRPTLATFTVVTGTSGAKFMRRYVMPLLERSAPFLSPRMLIVRNRLFGPSVSVSGLLTGRDILQAARRSGSLAGCLVIPPNAVNHAGIFLDDLRPIDLERELKVPVIVARSTFLERRVLRRCSAR